MLRKVVSIFMNQWHGYRSRFLKSMFSLKLSVAEMTLVAVLFAMMGLHVLAYAMAKDVGGIDQIRLARLQAQQALMASKNVQ